MTNKNTNKAKLATAAGSPNGTSGLVNLHPPVQEMFLQLKSQIEKEVGEVRKTLEETNRNLQQMCIQFNKTLETVVAVEKRVQVVEKQNKTLGTQITKQELESASYCLRLQGVTQKQDEDLYAIVAEILSPVIGMSELEFSKEVDVTFRNNTLYTRN